MVMKVTKCNNSEKEELLDFLKLKPAENCFLIGDIENFNLDEEFIDIWLLKTAGRVTSVLLRFYKYYIVYCENEKDIENICLQINKDKNCLNVAGIEETIDKMAAFLPIKELKREFLAELSKDSFKNQEAIHKPIKAKESDIDELFEFQKNIEEFSLTEDSRESFGKEIKSNTGRIYFCRYGNDIVSSATLTAENSINGMIIGVATTAEYRRKGYAKSCMNALCKELVTNGKSAILFYLNKDAGRLYKSIGFKDINRWAIASFK